MIATAALAVAGQVIMAHPSPSSAQQPVVIEVTKILPNGNTQVTEQNFVNNVLVKEEITVTNPQGQLVSKVETVFNAAGKVVKQETVTVTNGTVTKVEENFVNGMVVKREVEIVAVQNGQVVEIEREFRLVNGALALVKEEVEQKKKVEIAEVEIKNEIKKVQMQKGEATEAAAAENHGGGGGGHDGGGGHGGGGGGHDGGGGGHDGGDGGHDGGGGGDGEHH